MYLVSPALTPNGILSSASSRVQDIARNYQEFRITRMTVRVKPLYDTYIEGTSGSLGAPQLYFYANRDGDTPNGVVGMRQQGINPVSLAKDGNKTLSLKPSVVLAGQAGANIIRTSPWLNTNVDNEINGVYSGNSTPHYGCVIYIDTLGTADPANIATLEVELSFEFRRPQYAPTDATGTTPVVVL